MQATQCFLLVSMLIIVILLQLHNNAEGKTLPFQVYVVAYEASGEPLGAQIMVAQCIRNRMAERDLTAEEVCKQAAQFSCWDWRQSRFSLGLKDRTEAELVCAQVAWNMSVPIVSDVNLYHDTSDNPWWASSDKVTLLRQIGNLKFYYEKRG